MKALEQLGMIKNWLYETVVSCFDNHIPKAAPFGVKTPDYERLEFEMYNGSETLENVLQSGVLAVNMVDDPVFFYRALFDRDKLKFAPAKMIEAPVLDDSPASIEARIVKTEKKEFSVLLEAEVVHIKNRYDGRLINRAPNLFLESLIISTRIPYLPKGKPEELLKENLRVIRKVAPGSEYEKTMLGLLSKCSF